MPKIDEVEEFIGFMKAIFIMLIVIDTSLIAWKKSNIWRIYDDTNDFITYNRIRIVDIYNL